ncbi:hypothetical protein BN2476_990038 [Paraburkholderia piptadeniae]|uniref:Uncharacterized protein n=1 Tax=Paraburkholderia piptadeniae TaxID=1701573 RepID=A0A1N7SUR0_9BURK|nr:hypothetical protein BN2476_990038 [Paraburkholderia piptadeniae]
MVIELDQSPGTLGGAHILAEPNFHGPGLAGVKAENADAQLFSSRHC